MSVPIYRVGVNQWPYHLPTSRILSEVSLKDGIFFFSKCKSSIPMNHPQPKDLSYSAAILDHLLADTTLNFHGAVLSMLWFKVLHSLCLSQSKCHLPCIRHFLPWAPTDLCSCVCCVFTLMYISSESCHVPTRNMKPERAEGRGFFLNYCCMQCLAPQMIVQWIKELLCPRN